jgi:exodeoxyribonuclease VII large subunit
MPKPTTQDLFTWAGTQAVQIEKMPVLSVSEINVRVRQELEKNFGRVRVQGEISNLTRSAAGHIYFTLKDDKAQLAVALFRQDVASLKHKLITGLEVIAQGRLSVYARSGRYQMIAQTVAALGQGELHAAFDALKHKLQKAGLFSPERKKVLPMLPRKVAVVTSPHGAVIQDIIDVASRRYGRPHIVLVPTMVQGAQSAAGICQGLRLIAKHAHTMGVDVVIVARGGGSLEDLWGFNDEAVAHAVAECPVPVVSAVGHESDFTIADFVADVRAPTPSAAAELVFPLRQQWLLSLSESRERLRRSIYRSVQGRRSMLVQAKLQLKETRYRVKDFEQELGEATHSLDKTMRKNLADWRRSLNNLKSKLEMHHPSLRLQRLRHQIEGLRQGMQWNMTIHLKDRHLELTRTQAMIQAFRAQLEGWRSRIENHITTLNALSPLRVLDRGYCIVTDMDQRVVMRVEDVEVGARIGIRLAQGQLVAGVESKTKDRRT